MMRIEGAGYGLSLETVASIQQIAKAYDSRTPTGWFSTT